SIIKDIVLILLISIPIIAIFNRMHLPSIVGFLIAGIILGPSALKIISNPDQIEIMAEIGVILLMFSIGLELSLKELVKIKKILLLGGGLQVTATILISSIIIFVVGLPAKQAIFFGILVSLSSTVIVLKLLSDRDELDTPNGKISLGILIFQDLAIVPLFLIVNLLGTSDKVTFGEVSLQMLMAFGSVAAIIFIAKYLSPHVLYRLAKLRMKEIFTVGVILLILGTAYLTHSLGLSFAIGAFIAGLILSESEYSHQIVADTLPLKDAFNSLFFVSVGLLLNLSFVFESPLIVFTYSLGVVLIKGLIIFVVVLLLKYPVRIAILVGLGLAQVGEFSFIVGEQGFNLNLISPELFNIFISSTIITMILTPFLFKLAPRLAGKSSALSSGKSKEKIIEDIQDHVIIAGFGLNGRNLAHVLKETGIRYVIIEMNPETVKKEKAKGENIVYGDIGNYEVLKSARINKAKILVIAISDRSTSKRALKLAKELNPNIHVIVRTRFMTETDELVKMGAAMVIPEEFETSIQIFRKVLEQYHIPLNIIMQQVNLLRGESYKYLRSEDGAEVAFTHIDEILSARLTETFYLNEENKCAGKSIEELNLRKKTDATIIAIVRKGATITTPAAKEILQPGDTLVITGNHQAVDLAFNLLSGNTE
ncbi:MAG: cation:proton antiporter, partial [Ignavibacteriaceae bacterium]|nr:cation:proton antiporter [Ignavibacteriaceae bacterium]